MRGGHREPLKEYVVLGHHWPYADPDESESLESAIGRLSEILYCITYEDCSSIDKVCFLSINVEFALLGSEFPAQVPEQGNEVAIANYRYIKENLICLLEKKCWNKAVTYPPPAVLAALVREHFYADWDINFGYVNGLKVDTAGVFIDSNLKKTMQLFEPTIAVFFASLTVAKLRTPRKERDDNPTNADIDIGRTVLESMRKCGIMNPKVEAFKVAVRDYGHKASSKKMGVVFRLLTRKM